MTQTKDDAPTARFALDALGNSVQGAAPDWAELQAFRDETLSAQRRTEVLSHIANDAEVYQQWLDIAEAEHWLSNPANQQANESRDESAPRLSIKEKIARWFSPGNSALVGATALAIVAVAIVPMLIPQSPLSINDQFDLSAERYAAIAAADAAAPRVRNTRTLGAAIRPIPTVTVEKAYLLAGFRHVVQDRVKPESDAWTIWLDRTSGELPDCADAADQGYCTQVADDAVMLGQWTMLTWFGCRTLDSLPAGDAFWESQSTLWKSLRSSEKFTAEGIVASELTALDGTGPIELCDRAERLVVVARSAN